MIKNYITIIIAIASFIGGAIVDAKLLGKKCPDLKCPQPAACICPEQKPCQGIDFDKIKSKSITIDNKQYLTIKGDSMLVDKIREVVKSELEDFKVRRCR